MPRAAASAALASGGLCAALTAVAAVSARHAAPSEVSPVVPHGGWDGVWVGALVCALIAWVVGVALASRATASLSIALALAVVVQCVTLVAPLLLSKDAYLYWNESRTISVHHADPYTRFPDAFPHDPSLPYVSEEWRNAPAPYGPAWEVATLAPGAGGGTSAPHAELAFRAFSVLAVLGTVALVAAGTRNAAAVALLGWSPLVALHFGGGGHSDGWLMLLVLAAVLARRRASGGVAWSVAGALKPVPLVLLPLDVAASRLRRPLRFWIGLVAAALAILAASGATWGFGWIRASLVGVHGTSPLGGVRWLMDAGLAHRWAVVVGGLVFVAVYVGLLRSAWRSGRPRLALAATALCLTTSLLRPWYGIWPLALAALEEDAAGAVAAIALSAYLLLGDAVSL